MKRNFLCGLVLLSLVLLSSCSDSNDTLPDGDSIPSPPLLLRYELSSTTSVPSGFTFDPVERNFYLAGIGDGSIVRVDAEGRESELRAPDNLVSFWGAKVDAERRRLWICARDPEGIDNQMWVYDLNTDERVKEFLLGALWPKGDCNDLVLDENGIAYVTDPVNPNIYKLDPALGEGSIYLSDPLFTDVFGAGVGLNGIKITEDGSKLITATLAPATLFSVSLPVPDELVVVELEGDPLITPDGMEFLDGYFYSIAIGSVHRLSFNDAYTRATVSSQSGFNQVTSGTIAEGGLYVVKSQAVSFVQGSELDLPFEFFVIDLTTFD